MKWSSTMPTLLMWGAGLTPAAGQCDYGFKLLETCPGDTGAARAISEAGHVAGFSGPEGFPCAFVWHPVGGLQDLGPGVALAVNNLGQATGRLGSSAFFWDPKTGLQTIDIPGAVSSGGMDINEMGQVVGWSNTAAGANNAFFWDPVTGMQDLGPGRAKLINNVGQVVGAELEFVWDAANGRRDLWSFGGEAYSINDAGWIATGAFFLSDPNPILFNANTLESVFLSFECGEAMFVHENGWVAGWVEGGPAGCVWETCVPYIPGCPVGMLWHVETGQEIVLGEPFLAIEVTADEANADDPGQILVGAPSPGAGWVNGAVYWSLDGPIFALDSFTQIPDQTSAVAEGINEYGEIVGRSVNTNGHTSAGAFVIWPCPADVDDSGDVGMGDLLAVLFWWGPCPNPPTRCDADTNKDGTVDILDLLKVLADWNKSAEPPT